MREKLRKHWRALAAASLLAVPVPANAGWRDDLGTFRIGMLADPGTGRAVAGLAEIEQAFSDALDMPVKIFVAKDYAALIDAQATSRIEYAIYSAMAYATAQRLCSCLEPLASRLGVQNDTGIRSVLLLRKSALQGAGGPGDLKIAAVRGDSLSGALLPVIALSTSDGPSGIGSDQVVMAATDSEAVEMFANGTVDGLFGWSLASEQQETVIGSGTFAGLAARGIDPSALQVHWTSPLLRYGPHAVRSDIDKEARQILRDFLIGLNDRKPDIQELLTGSVEEGFVETKPDDYELALELVEHSRDN